MNVLLVVEDPLLRDLVKVGLEQFDGVRVTAGRGLAGVALARCRSYDCVFVGVEAAAQRGAELLKHLRRLEAAVGESRDALGARMDESMHALGARLEAVEQRQLAMEQRQLATAGMKVSV